MTTYNTGNPIGSTDPRDLKDNASSLDEAVVSEAATFIDRLGKSRLTLKGMEQVFDGGQPAIDAYYSAVEAADRAAAQIPLAAAEADRAETARDAALLSDGIFASSEAGVDPISGVSDGQYFSVPSADQFEFLILYKNSGGTAEEIERYPAVAVIREMASQIQKIGPSGYAVSFVGGDGSVAGGVKEDGRLTFKQIESESLLLSEELNNSGYKIKKSADPDYPFSIIDEQGNIAFAVKRNGKLVATIEGAIDSYRVAGVYGHKHSYIVNTGQSLGSGGANTEPPTQVAITTEAEYDNKIVRNAVNPSRPVGAVNYSSTGVEPPFFGMMGFAKELIDKENSVSYENFMYELVSANTASSGASIERISKGGADGVFERAVGVATFLKDYYESLGEPESFNVSAVLMTQGEANDTEEKDVYKPKMIQLAKDYNNDMKLITGQKNDVQMISYQLSSARAGADYKRGVQLAQLEASEEVPFIHVASPTYFMNYIDWRHVDSISSKWLGGYYGLVYKTVIVDKKEWVPLKPISHYVLENSITLFFSKNNLKFDTTQVPEQPDFGFSVKNELGFEATINSVEIVGSNAVRINLDSAPKPGWSVFYGFRNASNMGFYIGPAGNLRDSQGDYLVYESISRPMHNWCLIFKRKL